MSLVLSTTIKELGAYSLYYGSLRRYDERIHYSSGKYYFCLFEHSLPNLEFMIHRVNFSLGSL